MQRYCFEPAFPSRCVFERDKECGPMGWAIFDRIRGHNEQLGVVHDPLLAQQIVDDLNRRERIDGQ